MEAAKENKQLDFLKEHGVDTTYEALNAFIEEKAKEAENQKLSIDELDSVAGGGEYIDTAAINTTNFLESKCLARGLRIIRLPSIKQLKKEFS